MHDFQSLQADLKSMGVQPGDTLLMHSSMKSIGAVAGGADTVLDALSAYLEAGLLMLPTLTWELADQENPVFDVNQTPSLTGLLTEMFRKRPGVLRSWHPTHSLAALGRDAVQTISQDHLNHTPCGLTSSWHQLLERDGKIMMVGCDLTKCTFIHGVEEWCDVPGRFDPPVHFTVIRPDGTRFQIDSQPHHGFPSEQFGLAETALRASGALQDACFGDAKVMLLSARKTMETVSELLKENIHLFDDPK